THYRVERAFPESRMSLLAVRLETGRTHQIRVHLAAIGHPLAGDRTYRPGPDRAQAPRLRLHATPLPCSHPRAGGEMPSAAPLPARARPGEGPPPVPPRHPPGLLPSPDGGGDGVRVTAPRRPRRRPRADPLTRLLVDPHGHYRAGGDPRLARRARHPGLLPAPGAGDPSLVLPMRSADLCIVFDRRRRRPALPPVRR